MSVFQRGRLFAARTAIGLGTVVAFSFVAAGAAEASIGTAIPATTTARPDFRFVNILTGINAGRARFCFDKPLATPAPGSNANFRLMGYRWDTMLTGNPTPGLTPILDTNNQCADVLMSSHDLNSYTIGTVLANTTTANVSGGLPNLADSAPNVDAASNNGTRGHTTGPDLQTVTVGAPAGTNEMIYTFDQAVDSTTLLPVNFGYYDASGVVHTGLAVTGVSADGLSVRVTFAGPVNTNEAVQAFVSHIIPVPNDILKAGTGDTPAPNTYIPTLGVTVPGTSGFTARPDLVTAEIVPGSSNQMDFTYDKNVSTAVALNFYAVVSNGDESQATSATVLADGKTVRATFGSPNIANFLEEVVIGSANNAAVIGSNGQPSIASGKPAGGNANASATGYTNAPDANSVTFDATAGQATVFFDQRVAANASGQPIQPNVAGGLTGPTTPLTSWRLLNAAGNLIATPTSATVQSTGPFTSSVRLTFSDPNLLNTSLAKSLEVSGNQNSSGASPYVAFTGGPNPPAVYTFGSPHTAFVSGFNPAGNVQQILAPTASAAAFDLLGGKKATTFVRVHIVNKHSKHSKHHKHSKHSRHSR